MLPTTRLFSDKYCPFFKRGQCERPHCLYKHPKKVQDMFDASCKSSVVDSAGAQHGRRGAEAEDDTECLQELERINREIETVKNEVEKEQQKLLDYRTARVVDGTTVYKSEMTTAGNTVKRDHHRPRPHSTKTCPAERKYVVDISKPRTDLEYDPLSNFSADLRHCCSSTKDQKFACGGQALKKLRGAVCDDPTRSVVVEAGFAGPPSPELLVDLKEDGDVIDISSSPDENRGQDQEPAYPVVLNSWSIAGELGVECAPISMDQPVNAEVKSPVTVSSQARKADAKCAAESAEELSYVSVSKKCGSKPGQACVFDDLSMCLEDLRNESHKMPSWKAIDPVVKSGSDKIIRFLPKASWSPRDPFMKHQEDEEESPIYIDKINPGKQQNISRDGSILQDSPDANPSHLHHHLTRQGLKTECTDPISWSSLQNGPAASSSGQKMQSLNQRVAPIAHVSPIINLEQATTVGSGRTSTSDQLHGTNHVNSPFTPSVQPPAKATNQEEILEISSLDEAESISSDVDLSDSDPMEECYRIFMEANANENGATEKTTLPVEDSNKETPTVELKPQTLPGQKRVVHVAKYTEPLAKRRPQPMVLVPLQEPSTTRLSDPSKILQVQQRTSIPTTTNTGQAFVFPQRMPENKAPPVPPYPQSTANEPATLRSTRVTYLPVGTTVLQLGNNMHLVIPEGLSFPITSIANPGASFLTPITAVNGGSFTPVKTHHPTSVTPVHGCHPTPPTTLYTPAYTYSCFSSSMPAHTSQATHTSPPAAVHVPAKPLPMKRKGKQRHEEVKENIPRDIRQRYINQFTEEFLRMSANVEEAFEKALAEEKAVYNRSVNKLKYLSVAVNVLKKLKNQSTVAMKGKRETCVQRSRGSIPLNLKRIRGNIERDAALYESLKEYILTEEKLIENNYPFQDMEKPGSAILFSDNKKGPTDPFKRICCRCGATFTVSHSGKHTRMEECIYHYGKGVENKVPGGVETRYSCCEAVMGAPGCQVFQLHVHDAVSMDGFVSTHLRDELDSGCPGVYALDCEMCYTTQGLELSRVTVVSSSLQVVYDTFVRPDDEVIDYNTRFSGISKEDVRGTNTTIREVQQTLLQFIRADTILIGHGLETDLCALKFLHGMVVDTSVVFPHCLGPPHKLTLSKLTADYLRRIIQDSVCGHDTAEDAMACIELMLWKVKDDGKMKK